MCQIQRLSFSTLGIGAAMFALCLPTGARAAPGDQLDKILPSDGAARDSFGFSVAYNGVLALSGAIGDNQGSGSVYVYDVESRQMLSTLRADDVRSDALFGYDVAIDGSFAVVGSPGGHNFGVSTGSAYVFDLSDPDNPQQVVKLLSQDIDSNDTFGLSVAISGSIAIIGVPLDDDRLDNSGSAYLFDIHSGAQLAKLRASVPRGRSRFGTAVGIAGSFAVVGADSRSSGGPGAAYIFDVSDPTRPVEIAKIVPDDGFTDDFGRSLAMSTERVVIGRSRFGVVVFDLATARQITELIPATFNGFEDFGSSIGISRNLVIVGAPRDDDNGTDSGSAFVFDISDPNNPIEITGLFAKDGVAGDAFGFSVAISGLTAIAGAVEDDDNGDRSGSAYLFDAANCPADLDDDDDVDADDFFVFLDAFATGDLRVCDILGDGDCDAADFFAYLDLFAAGCD